MQSRSQSRACRMLVQHDSHPSAQGTWQQMVLLVWTIFPLSAWRSPWQVMPGSLNGKRPGGRGWRYDNACRLKFSSTRFDAKKDANDLHQQLSRGFS